MAERPVIVWFQDDLRLLDNPALHAAAKEGPVICLYVLDDHTPGKWKIASAQRWWLHHSLVALDESLRRHGCCLTLASGDAATIVPKLAAQTDAAGIHWNRRYTPSIAARDERIAKTLAKDGRAVHLHRAALLFEPGEVTTGGGTPFRMFTPFWRKCREQADIPGTLPLPELSAAPPVDGVTLESLGLLPKRPDWSAGLAAACRPGEGGAQARWRDFLPRLQDYARMRDLPASGGASGLSPHIRFGEISVRQLWHDALPRAHGSASGDKFLAELGWREFNYQLLSFFPGLPEKSFAPDFEHFEWQPNAAALSAWKKGRTGYPIVDAGMRELWASGTMHNRVRLVTASFLVKHLLTDWREGEAWFWDTLVDADLANNAANWQWVAGSGADAAPYFRIFNPVMQSKRFDAQGDYLRLWLPELAGLHARDIHTPWAVPESRLRAAGVTLGKTYPKPIVDHDAARLRALEAYAGLRRRKAKLSA